MKIIWTGTDSLFLVKFPKQLKWSKIFYVLALRIFARITDIFTQEHYACGELVYKNLTKFGFNKKIVYFKDVLNYDYVVKKTHEGFNILYYFPKRNTRFTRWLYGRDVYENIKKLLNFYSDIHFIEVDGSQDLNEIYPVTDMLIRPNRHDGHPRMVDECMINEIPCVASKQNPMTGYFIFQILNKYHKNGFIKHRHTKTSV